MSPTMIPLGDFDDDNMRPWNVLANESQRDQELPQELPSMSVVIRQQEQQEEQQQQQLPVPAAPQSMTRKRSKRTSPAATTPDAVYVGQGRRNKTAQGKSAYSTMSFDEKLASARKVLLGMTECAARDGTYSSYIGKNDMKSFIECLPFIVSQEQGQPQDAANWFRPRMACDGATATTTTAANNAAIQELRTQLAQVNKHASSLEAKLEAAEQTKTTQAKDIKTLTTNNERLQQQISLLQAELRSAKEDICAQEIKAASQYQERAAMREAEYERCRAQVAANMELEATERNAQIVQLQMDLAKARNENTQLVAALTAPKIAPLQRPVQWSEANAYMHICAKQTTDFVFLPNTPYRNVSVDIVLKELNKTNFYNTFFDDIQHVNVKLESVYCLARISQRTSDMNEEALVVVSFDTLQHANKSNTHKLLLTSLKNTNTTQSNEKIDELMLAL